MAVNVLIQVTLKYTKYEVDIYMNDNVTDLFIVETRERRLEARQAIHLMTSGSLITRIKGGLKLRLVEMLLLFFITKLTHVYSWDFHSGAELTKMLH